MLKNTRSNGNWYFVLDVMASHPKTLLLPKRKKVNIYSFQYTC